MYFSNLGIPSKPTVKNNHGKYNGLNFLGFKMEWSSKYSPAVFQDTKDIFWYASHSEECVWKCVSLKSGSFEDRATSYTWTKEKHHLRYTKGTRFLLPGRGIGFGKFNVFVSKWFFKRLWDQFPPSEFVLFIRTSANKNSYSWPTIACKIMLPVPL